tara:strand:- start:633 stop:896 length:264 start_codon:yes stop_codon:yes gene_type:complete
MKTVVGAEQTVVRVEVVLKPIEVQVPVITIPVEVRHITVAIRIPPDIIYKISSMPPSFEVLKKTILELYLIRSPSLIIIEHYIKFTP